MKIRNLLFTLAMAGSLALLAGCNFDGGVEQGRCVAFDPAAKTMTIVVDVTHDQFNPHYSGGVHTFKLPVEAKDMGPAPMVGGRLMIDINKSVVLLYDQASKSVRELPVQFTDVEKNIGADHPKVAGKTFPGPDHLQGAGCGPGSAALRLDGRARNARGLPQCRKGSGHPRHECDQDQYLQEVAPTSGRGSCRPRP